MNRWDGAVFLWAIFLVGCFLALKIRIEISHIPTVVNGMATVISVTVGLAVATITLGLSDRLSRFDDVKSRALFSMFLLLMAISLLVIAYAYIVYADFHASLRTAMIGLVVSSATLFDIIFYLQSL